MKVNSKAIFFIALVFLLPCAFAHYVTEDSSGTLLILDKEPPLENEDITLMILLKDPLGNPITNLDTVHERKLHAFMLSQELDVFNHFHPEDFPDGYISEKNGTYHLHYKFPHAGEYILALDYTVEGKTVLSKIPITIFGEERPAQGMLIPNKVSLSGEYGAELETPHLIFANSPTRLSFTVRKNSFPVNDLGMYLGSEIHALAVSEDLDSLQHTHSYRPGHYVHVGTMTQKYSGPTVPIELSFPKEGTYVIFSQFMHEGEVITFKHIIHVYKGLSFEDSLAVFLTQIVVSALILWLLRATRYRIIFLLIFLALIVASAIVLMQIQAQPMDMEKSTVVGNPTIISKVDALRSKAIQDDNGDIPIRQDDLKNLTWDLYTDKTAIAFLEEAKWMIANNETEHAQHSLEFLQEYLKTGEQMPCFPHELWHIGIFLEHNDVQRALPIISTIDQQNKEWESIVERKQKAYPQFFTGLDSLKLKIAGVIPRLKKYDFSEETKEQLNEIGIYTLC